jgi:hypothetical protein
MRYATAAAFRMALEEHISRLHKTSNVAIARLRKRIAFEMFLKRLQAHPNSPWILKGAVALDLRFGNRARATKDLDLGVDSSIFGAVFNGPVEIARQLQAAAVTPIEDFFFFTLPGKGEDIPLEPGGRAYRFRVRVSLAERPFEEFRLDVGLNLQLVGPPEEIPGSDILTFAGFPRDRFRAIPLSQHFADKVHALTFPWKDRENTRVKDLVDLVLILEVGPPDPDSARLALESVFERRGTHPLPTRILDPPSLWAGPFHASATEIGLSHVTVDAAMEFLRAQWTRIFP